MTQLTTAEAARINRQNRANYETGLGDRLRAVEGGSIATGTEAQIPICDAEGVPTPKTISGDITVTAAGAVSIGNNKITNAKMADDAIDTAEIADDAIESAQVADEAILEPHLKVVNRDVTIAAEGTSATVTNAADINGFLGQAHFTAASPDATAVEITSVRFVAATGALTVTVNAAATAETVVRVPVIQAA
jgi:hypothetical protein